MDALELTPGMLLEAPVQPAATPDVLLPGLVEGGKGLPEALLTAQEAVEDGADYSRTHVRWTQSPGGSYR